MEVMNLLHKEEKCILDVDIHTEFCIQLQRTHGSLEAHLYNICEESET